MLTWATTRVSILEGTDTDEFGDPVDGATVAASGIPASIIEQSKTVRDRADEAPRTVRSYPCRLPAGTAVTIDNRIRDDATGAVYVIDSLTSPANPLWRQDLHLDLRRTTST